MTTFTFALIVYLVVPGGEYYTYIPMEEQSCRNGEIVFTSFDNTEKLSMAAYCREIR